MEYSVRFWEPGKAFRAIEPEMLAVMRDVLESGDLVMRQQLLDFERHLAEFVGVADAVGVGNCTDGLMLIRYLFGLRGPALIANAIGAGAARTTAAAIEAYIQTIMP